MKEKSPDLCFWAILKFGPAHAAVIATNEFGCSSWADSVDVTFRPDTNQLEILMIAEKGYMDFGSVIYPRIYCIARP